MKSLGLDFGTSNCTAHVASPGGVATVPLENASPLLPSVVFAARREGADDGRDGFWDQTFLSILRTGQAMQFGTPALEAYIADPLSGILLKSPKSFLGSSLEAQHLVQFENVLYEMLKHIRAKAETFAGDGLSAVAIGRPVNYQGVQDEEGNAQALNLTETAARRAGFKDIHFVMEPVAAAFEYENALTREATLLVIDIGGGTTDCAVVRVGPDRQRRVERDKDVIGYSGDRVGGTDFDQALAWMNFMPYFGKDTHIAEGRPLPHSLLIDAISTRSVPAQIRFRKAGNQIRAFLRESDAPAKLRRLELLHDQQLQHRLIQSAELAKMRLSDTARFTAPLDYIEAGLSVPLSLHDLEHSAARHLDRIRALAEEAVKTAGTRPDIIFATGGMAISPAVREALKSVVGNEATIEYRDMLGSVGKGLGLYAARLFK